MTDMAGRPVSLADLRGRPLLINSGRRGARRAGGDAGDGADRAEMG